MSTLLVRFTSRYEHRPGTDAVPLRLDDTAFNRAAFVTLTRCSHLNLRYCILRILSIEKDPERIAVPSQFLSCGFRNRLIEH
eukprot:1179323-Prorocentrum_minimum.AAC.7